MLGLTVLYIEIYKKDVEPPILPVTDAPKVSGSNQTTTAAMPMRKKDHDHEHNVIFKRFFYLFIFIWIKNAKFSEK